MRNLRDTQRVTQMYWIQEQAPAGNFFDSIGMSGKNEAEAINEFKSWQKSFPDRVVRLVVRLDVEVLQ